MSPQPLEEGLAYSCAKQSIHNRKDWMDISKGCQRWRDYEGFVYCHAFQYCLRLLQ